MEEVISLEALLVNAANDRHGDLKAEEAAIVWLLKNKKEQMKNLARDIVERGEVYERPLVSPDGDHFMVWDGNRRVTCLKLLSEPGRATTDLIEFFADLRRKCARPIWEIVQCQVETDLERIDEILYRRHTGAQKGVGQSDWDDRAKANFVGRTGKHQKINIAELVEKSFRESGDVEKAQALPRSNFNRLLSGEATRNRVGLSLTSKGLYFTHDPEDVMATLHRIADDMCARRVVLGDIWDNSAKMRYLDMLEQDNLLPNQDNLLVSPQAFKASAVRPRGKGASAKVGGVATTTVKPHAQRKTLIPSDVDFKLKWSSSAQRIKSIWGELQFNLTFDRHVNAISVLLRVLVEVSTDLCIKDAGIDTVHRNDKLSTKIEKTANFLLDRKIIDEKYFREIKKLSHGERIISSDTMHRYVHSTTLAPSPDHLVAIWDTMAQYVVSCLGLAFEKED